MLLGTMRRQDHHKDQQETDYPSVVRALRTVGAARGRHVVAYAPEGSKTFCDVVAWKGAMETIDSLVAVTTTSIMMMITRFR